MEGVKKTFNEIAERYDVQRRKLIPCFDDFYRTVVEMVGFRLNAEFVRAENRSEGPHALLYPWPQLS